MQNGLLKQSALRGMPTFHRISSAMFLRVSCLAIAHELLCILEEGGRRHSRALMMFNRGFSHEDWSWKLADVNDWLAKLSSIAIGKGL